MPDTTSRSAINGIDVKALDETIAAVRKDPACGRAAFRVTTQWKGQTRSETRVDSFAIAGTELERSFTIVADEPTELLGADAAPSPGELLMAAVNACLVTCYVAQASMRGIRLDDCRIECSGELDLRGFFGIDESIPPGYRRLCYTVSLEGDGSRDQFEEIHQAVMATSPNLFNLAQPIQMCGKLA